MEPKTIIRNTIEQQKNVFNASYKTLLIAQGQVEQLASSFWKQANIPQEGIKTFENAINECNKGRDNFKKFIDDSYSKVETFFSA